MAHDVPFEAMPVLDQATMWSRLEQVVEIGNRFAGSPGEARCRELILAEFAAAGLELDGRGYAQSALPGSEPVEVFESLVRCLDNARVIENQEVGLVQQFG